MTNCFNGITSPQTITDECNGIYTSTSCIQSPNANTTLSLPAGATQTEINGALTTALIYKEQQIQNLILLIEDLTTRIEILETP